MGASRKSFFSSVPGVITGAAGVLSAVVGAAGLAVQQGWIGGDSETTGSGASGQAGAQGSRGSGGGSGASVSAAPKFSVEPTSVSFQAVGSRQAKVKVRNTGTVPLTVESPTVTGDDADRFSASEGSCDEALDPGRSCELEVTFSPRTGTFTAVLVVEAEGGAKASEVPLKGSAVL